MIPSKTARTRLAAQAALSAAVAWLPAPSQADSCTPPDPAPTTLPLAIACVDDGSPPGNSYSYTSGPHVLTLVDGNFRNLGTGDGADVVEVLGGSAGGIQTDADNDRITVRSGAVGAIVAGDGDDQVLIEGGAVGLVQGNDGDDEIRVTGGTLNSIFAGPGRDNVFLDGAASVRTQIRGEDGLDRLILTGTGLLDGSFTEIETLVVDSGADWVFRRSDSAFDRGLILLPNSALDLEAGRTLSVGDVIVGTGATLSVDGTLDFSPRSVGFALTGTLTGSGTVLNSTGRLFFDINPTGVIRPGIGGIGTLTVTTPGLVFKDGAQLVAEVDPLAAQRADLLVVNGEVRDTDRLSILVEPANPGGDAASYAAAGDFVVLRATTLDGDAPTVIEGGSLPALVDVAIVGSPSASGEVALSFTEVPLAALPLRPAVTTTGNKNHASVVGGIATVATSPTTPPGSTTPTLVSGTTVAAAAGTLTKGDLAALNSVHAEPFSSYQTVMLEDYDMVAGIVLGHAGRSAVSFGGFSTPERGLAGSAMVGRGPLGEGTSDAWASLALVDGSVEGRNGLGSFGYAIGGLVLGTDVYDAGGLRAGVYGAINRTRLSEHDGVEQTIDGRSYHLGAYASWEAGRDFFISGVTGLAFGRHDSERVVPDVGAFTGGTATSSFDTRGLYLGAQIERSFDMGGAFTLTPSASAVYSRTIQKASGETGGGDFSFALGEAQADSLATSIGVTARRSVDASGQNWTVVGSAHYTRDWLAGEDDLHDVTVTNPIFGSYTQVGQNRGANGVTAGLGISGRLSEAIEVGAGYAYSWNDNGDEHGISASVSVTW